jgi:hypothetical protein
VWNYITIPHFPYDEVGIKIVIFSKYDILPDEMTEKICTYWIVYVLFMELWKMSLATILTPALHRLLQLSHIYFWLLLLVNLVNSHSILLLQKQACVKFVVLKASEY